MRAFILLVSIACATLTFRLGVWQWSRAEQKWALDESLQHAQSLTPFNTQQLVALEDTQNALNQRPSSSTLWLSEA